MTANSSSQGAPATTGTTATATTASGSGPAAQADPSEPGIEVSTAMHEALTGGGEPAGAAGPLVGERAELLATLRQRRFFLRYTARDLTDEQATRRTTASALTVAGVIKHVARGERDWMEFVRKGTASSMYRRHIEKDYSGHEQSFRLEPGETLASVLGWYEQVARDTDELIATLPDLDATQPLPPAPWFESGAHWSARQVLLSLIGETAQHAGHADIIRESLDGAKTMG